MRLRTILVLTALVLAVSPATGAAKVGHVRMALDSSAAFPSYSQSAQRNGVVILQAWQQERMRALKQANPGITVLVYKNLAFINEGSSESGLSSSGVAYKEANAQHPEWFLQNTSGSRFTSNSYHYLWAADVGERSYQERWADGVLAELRSSGWDGVFMDDTNATMRHHYSVPAVAKYPSDSAYRGAVRTALATIGPRVSAAGKLAVANIGSWGEFPSVGNDWLQFLDGAMDEMFLKWGTTPGQGYAPSYRWQAQLDALKLAESHNKLYLAVTHSSAVDRDAARYGYGTMLLGSNGRGHFTLAQDYTNETWFPEYDYELGQPKGPESGSADGVHRREFERGLVLVNPSGQSRAVTFGDTYSGSGLENATGATLAPTSALVLTRHDETSNAPATVRREPISVLATAKAPRRVSLRWRGSGPIVKYRIKRGGRTVATVRRLRFGDRRARPGRLQRYRIVGLARDGKVIGRSGVVRIRTPHRSRHGAAISARARFRLVAALAGPSRWTRAYVQVRVRVGRRVTWRRLTKPVRPRAAMRFRLPLRRRATVRLVVESKTGTALRSGVVRAGPTRRRYSASNSASTPRRSRSAWISSR
jgi:hypothetical protein